jgi:hypothetical protein
MKNLKFIALLVATLFTVSPLFFTSCTKDDATPVVVVKDSTSVMVFHTNAAAATVKILADSRVISDSISYGKGTGYKRLEAGSRTIASQLLGGTGVTSDVLSFEKDKNYTVFIYRDSTTTVKTLTTLDKLETPPSGSASLRLVHLLPDLANIPINVEGVLPGGAVGTGGPIYMGVMFKDVKDFMVGTPGTYDILLKNTAGQLLLRVSNLTLSSGKIYTFVLSGGATKAPNVVVINNN